MVPFAPLPAELPLSPKAITQGDILLLDKIQFPEEDGRDNGEEENEDRISDVDRAIASNSVTDFQKEMKVKHSDSHELIHTVPF